MKGGRIDRSEIGLGVLVLAATIAACTGTTPTGGDSQTKRPASEPTCDSGSRSPSVDLARSLLSAFPPAGRRGLLSQSRADLLRFFDAQVVALLEREVECVRQSGGVCHLSFNPLLGVQDFSGGEIRFCASDASPDVVQLQFASNGAQVVVRILTHDTANGRRIGDIQYAGGGSLVGALSKK